MEMITEYRGCEDGRIKCSKFVKKFKLKIESDGICYYQISSRQLIVIDNLLYLYAKIIVKYQK